ncbi:MAG: hypothetical protein WC562_02635 [Dehalococcoidia bacterium]
MQIKEPIMKIKLPLKTKIAVWWLAVCGMAVVLILIIGILTAVEGSYGAAFNLALIIMIPAIVVMTILIVLPIIALRMKSKWSWIVAVVLLSVYVTGDIVWLLSDLSNADLLAPGIIMLVPLLLIILDRRSYFEMVRQWKLEKNVG